MGKTMIVAELSANHNHDFDLAVKTIEAMAKAGADAVKFQTFRPDSFTLDADTEDFGPRKDGLWKGYRPIDLYTQGSMPYEWQSKLMKLANDLGCKYFEGSAKTGENIVEAMDEVTKISYQCYKETEKRNSIRISSQSHNSDKEKKKKKCC